MKTLKTEFKTRIKAAVIVCLITCPIYLHSQNLNPVILFEPINMDENNLSPSQKKILKIFQQDNSTIDLRLIKVDMNKLMSQTKTFRLDLFSGEDVTAIQEKVELREDNGIRWFGYVPEQSSSVAFSAKGNALAGYLFIGNNYYNVFPIGEGINALIHIDPKKHSDCGNRFHSGPNIKLQQPTLDINSHLINTFERSSSSGNLLNNKKSNKIDNINQTDTIVKVLVVYTSTAKSEATNNDENIEEIIDNAITAANQAFDLSDNVPVQLQLAHKEEISNYAETSNWGSEFDHGECSSPYTIYRKEVLDHLRNPSDGYMDEVHDLRGLYGADVVVLLTGVVIGLCGQAYAIPASSNDAFCIVRWNCASSSGDWSLAHEVGHLIGARHQDDSCNFPAIYGHGYTEPSRTWRTLMSVDPAASRILRWSSPDVYHQGIQMGTASSNDVARLLEEEAPTYANYAKEYTGTITTNTTLSGIVLLDGVTITSGATVTVSSNAQVYIKTDLVVDNNAILDINAGAKIKFAGPGVDLWVNNGAKLDAVGTASQPITFTSAQANPGSKSWGTIFLHTSNNRLEHCTVEYGDWGIKVYGYPSTSSGNVIKNCTTRVNDQGVRIQNTTVTVENTTIEDNRHAFVILSNSTSTLTGNSVSENDRDGIYSSSAVIDLFSNLLENNGLGNSSTYHGIYAGSGDDISLGSRSFSSNPNTAGGFNTIRSNHGAGIFVASSATVTAGIVSGGTSYLAGSNSIHSNGTQTGTSYTGKDFYNASSTTQMAENNYWGGNCPPAGSQIYGSVDTDYCLTTSPTGLSPMPKPAMLTESNGPIDLDTQTKQAIIDQNKQIIASQPNTQAAVEALRQYYSFVRTDVQNKLGQKSGMYAYLDGIYQQHSTLDLGKAALQLMILESQRIGDLANAIALSETALTEVSPADRSGVQFNLILLYLHDGLLTNAQNLLADFKSRYPKELTAIEILESTVAKAPELYAVTDTKIQSVASPAAGQSAGNAAESAKTGKVLFESYPNPFNRQPNCAFNCRARAQCGWRFTTFWASR